MTKKSDVQAQRDEAIKTLQNNYHLKIGTEVYTILRHTSQSGMTRHISTVIVDEGGIHDITYLVARILGYSRNGDGGLIIGGCGMDMGFEVVYSLGRELFPKGFKVEGRGRNGDTSGWDNDGGYALKQRWL